MTGDPTAIYGEGDDVYVVTLNGSAPEGPRLPAARGGRRNASIVVYKSDTLGPDHLLPAVGENRDGVVLVAWYDQREAKDNLGLRLRAAALLDGGETFSASMPVADDVNAYTDATR